MKHQEVYFTCDNCGTKMTGEHTEVRAVNTDPASVVPEKEYHLCAQHWLEVEKHLDQVRIKAAAVRDADRREWLSGDDDYHHVFDDRA